ncbi:hypothetical protein RRF57_010050 [Xylaria bambusicola]|uniref:Uncharacterized protein n=1 Tax=Xylaria bambusicola TaxID=326684 RepID=A0AAN7UWN3_9PEZI
MRNPLSDPDRQPTTNLLWWDSDEGRATQVKEDQELHQCLTHFISIKHSLISIHYCSIITDEAVPLSKKETKSAGFYITKQQFDKLITAFHLSPSFKKWKSSNAGYHDYIKDNPGIHDESLIFAAQSPRLRDSALFFTMRIWPRTNSIMCIITVPTVDRISWLWGELTDHHPRIMTCPVYLFNILCKRLDCENEAISSTVLNTFEKQEREMQNFCRKIQTTNENKMYKEHRNAIIQLNTLNMDLMTLGCTTDFELSALTFAKSLMTRYTKLYESSNSPNSLPRMSDDELQDFNDEIESLQTSAQLRQTMRTHAQDRAERMVSLLSAHNLQRDMINTQTISEHSRNTSWQARNLMILGSLFIPPTFVATLFSSNIFTVNPQTGKVTVVQPLGWLLGVSAGGLIALVILGMLIVCIWPKKILEDLKSRCPLNGPGRDATIPAKEYLLAEQQV